MNAYGVLQTYRYSLEPGDATRYQFSIADMRYLNPGYSSQGVQFHDYDIVSGVDDGYVQLSILMPSSQGSYEVSREQLRNPSAGFVQYLKSKMPRDMYMPTLLAIVLAASVLVDEMTDIDGAAQKMAKWPEFYDKWFGDNDEEENEDDE